VKRIQDARFSGRKCKIHGLQYDYVCPKCLQPYLEQTRFSDLAEIRQYQINMAEKVIQEDKENFIESIGILKIKIENQKAFCGFFSYDFNQKKIIFSKFRIFEPIFSEYFPSVLFLNQTKLYLALINSVETHPDCYLLNASGRIHPFLYGIACDVGMRIDIPVFGYTQKLLYGHEMKDDNSELHTIKDQDEIIGMGIPRPNSNKYYYISVGNNITLQRALKTFQTIDCNIFSELKVKLNNYIQELGK